MEASIKSNKSDQQLQSNIEFVTANIGTQIGVNYSIFANGIATIKSYNKSTKLVSLQSIDGKSTKCISIMQFHNILQDLNKAQQQTIADSINFNKKTDTNIRKGLKLNASAKTIEKRLTTLQTKLQNMEFFVNKYLGSTIALDNRIVSGGWGKLIAYDNVNKLVEVVTTNQAVKMHVKFSIFAMNEMMEAGKAQYKAWKQEQKLNNQH